MTTAIHGTIAAHAGAHGCAAPSHTPTLSVGPVSVDGFGPALANGRAMAAEDSR